MEVKAAATWATQLLQLVLPLEIMKLAVRAAQLVLSQQVPKLMVRAVHKLKLFPTTRIRHATPFSSLIRHAGEMTVCRPVERSPVV